MSASTKPLSHLFFSEILNIDTHLRKWQAKPAFKVMATKMRSKYEKYLGKLYDITPENPMSNKDLEQMMSNMVDEVEERMGVLFKMYKESSIDSGNQLKGFNLHQDWVRKSRKPINVDSLEDLFNDDEIVKDMEYELEKTSENDKGEQDVE
ncbi:zinc finger BED domain-containing protein RICESLEEPER 2 [Tanacetum coccineum]